MNVDIIVGARPNFIKAASLINAIQNAQSGGTEIFFRLIHTGQHYDKNMSGSFFEQLDIPLPKFNLSVGGGSQAEQTAGIMIGYEKILREEAPDLCIVVGDVNSTMACSITAKKIGIKVAHIEAGIRSNDLKMPEEINRIVTDSISDYFFTTTNESKLYLQRQGVQDNKIFFVGNTMIDTLLRFRSKLKKPNLWKEINLELKNYIVLTLHRPSNVDNEMKLKEIIERIIFSSNGHEIIFPVHPRTLKILEKLNIKSPKFHPVNPLSYLEFNYLVEKSKGVITDSGGINPRLIEESALATATRTAAVIGATGTITFSGGLTIASGQLLQCCQSVYAGVQDLMHFIAVGGDY